MQLPLHLSNAQCKISVLRKTLSVTYCRARHKQNARKETLLGLFETIKQAIACSGCEPGLELAYMYNPADFDLDLYTKEQVVQTCSLALNGLGLSIQGRRLACLARAQEPDALLKCEELQRRAMPPTRTMVPF